MRDSDDKYINDFAGRPQGKTLTEDLTVDVRIYQNGI